MFGAYSMGSHIVYISTEQMPDDSYLYSKHVTNITLLNILLCFWLKNFLFSTTTQQNGSYQMVLEIVPIFICSKFVG
jgi:hypothetical protein